MYRGLLPLLAVVASTYGGVPISKVPYLDGRIVGGEDAKIEDFPYQVLVLWKGKQHCGGSILKPSVVVSAAHCFDPNVPKDYTIQYGSAEKFNGKTVQVKRINNHEKFDARTADYDISLLFLAEDIVFGSNAQPIALTSETPVAGTKSVCSGWGRLYASGPGADILQKVQLEIREHDDCRKQFDNVQVTDRMICAGFKGSGEGACRGDSGGPLVANNELVGIVSWGSRFCDYPTVFANVAILQSWIDPQISIRNP